MPKTKTQLEKIKAERKEKIILAGLKVFCEKGFEGAKVEDIVARAGCSHGLFYHYFKNKREIFDEIVKRSGGSSLSAMKFYLTDETQSYAQRLKNLLVYNFDTMYSDQNFSYYFYFFVSRWFLKANADGGNVTMQQRPLPKILYEFFKNAQESGEFSAEHSPEECCALLHCIIQGSSLNTVLVTSPKKNLPPPNIDLIVDIFRKKP
ncbi:MAG: hypothetical protein DBX59_02550 [Bacillota bacterium]|nr:MAG: hypothetical protein DBX59_02550 [Bacillota bacterium]